MAKTPSPYRLNWETNRLYTAGEVSISSGYKIICITTHTSGTYATDVALGYWQMEAPWKNYIINGNLDTWQRNTSFTINPGGSGGVYTADRFSINDYFLSGQLGVTKSSDVPSSAQACTSSLATTVNTTVVVNSGASSYMFHGGRYYAEGQDIKYLYNKPITISFWVKSSTTGAYVLSFGNLLGSSSARYNASYTISSANTWEKKSITFNLNTSYGTFATDNTTGIFLQFSISVNTGSVYYGGVTDAWQSSAFYLQNATNNRTEMLAAGSVFKVAQVMINEGPAPAIFQTAAPNMQAELAMCQRYYEIVPLAAGNSWGRQMIMAQATTYAEGTWACVVPKRASVTPALVGAHSWSNGVGAASSPVETLTAGTSYGRISFTSTGLTIGQYLISGAGGVVVLTVDAEL